MSCKNGLRMRSPFALSRIGLSLSSRVHARRRLLRTHLESTRVHVIRGKSAWKASSAEACCAAWTRRSTVDHRQHDARRGSCADNRDRSARSGRPPQNRCCCGTWRQ